MSERLASGGLLIDRNRPVSFTFDGKRLSGLAGDTLASALLANGRVLVGRSFKYHRPRGVLASGAEEPNALMGVGEGARFEPNQRATVTPLHEGLVARSQNRWPSLQADIGAVGNWTSKLAPVFLAGFYYKTFLWPRQAWKWIYEPAIRRAAGLGRAPTRPDPDRYEHFHAHVDTLVVGGGIAGLRAAREAAEAGREVLLVEQSAHWGGRALVDGDRIDGHDGPGWVREQVSALEAMPNIRLRTRAMAAGLYDHGYVTVSESVADDHPGIPGAPRHRLWRIRGREIVLATGALERPLVFANNDLPGVMLASAVRDYIRLWGVLPGRRAVVFANNDDAYRTALALADAGATVAAVLDTRREVNGELPRQVRARGIQVRPGHAIDHANGRRRVASVELGHVTGTGGLGGTPERIDCDLIAVSGGWSPAVHLWSHCAGGLRWDQAGTMFRPDDERPPLGADGEAMARCVGAADGVLRTAEILPDVSVEAPREAPLEPFWFAPSRGTYAHGTKHFVDFQNDVTAADVRLSAREGYESVEHAKRYTTLGMATDQGKTSNINGLAILADERGVPVPEVGTTTFRPPYSPISFGSITGQTVALGVDQPVERSIIEPLAQCQCAAEAGRKPLRVDHRIGIRVEKARSDLAVGVEGCHAQRPFRIDQAHERAGRQLARPAVHRDLVRKRPGRALGQPASLPRAQLDGRTFARLVVG